jgi:hypothetical protein
MVNFNTVQIDTLMNGGFDLTRGWLIAAEAVKSGRTTRHQVL